MLAGVFRRKRQSSGTVDNLESDSLSPLPLTPSSSSSALLVKYRPNVSLSTEAAAIVLQVDYSNRRRERTTPQTTPTINNPMESAIIENIQAFVPSMSQADIKTLSKSPSIPRLHSVETSFAQSFPLPSRNYAASSFSAASTPKVLPLLPHSPNLNESYDNVKFAAESNAACQESYNEKKSTSKPLKYVIYTPRRESSRFVLQSVGRDTATSSPSVSFSRTITPVDGLEGPSESTNSSAMLLPSSNSPIETSELNLSSHDVHSLQSMINIPGPGTQNGELSTTSVIDTTAEPGGNVLESDESHSLENVRSPIYYTSSKTKAEITTSKQTGMTNVGFPSEVDRHTTEFSESCRGLLARREYWVSPHINLPCFSNIKLYETYDEDGSNLVKGGEINSTNMNTNVENEIAVRELTSDEINCSISEGVKDDRIVQQNARNEIQHEEKQVESIVGPMRVMGLSYTEKYCGQEDLPKVDQTLGASLGLNSMEKLGDGVGRSGKNGSVRRVRQRVRRSSDSVLGQVNGTTGNREGDSSDGESIYCDAMEYVLDNLEEQRNVQANSRASSSSDGEEEGESTSGATVSTTITSDDLGSNWIQEDELKLEVNTTHTESTGSLAGSTDSTEFITDRTPVTRSVRISRSLEFSRNIRSNRTELYRDCLYHTFAHELAIYSSSNDGFKEKKDKANQRCIMDYDGGGYRAEGEVRSAGTDEKYWTGIKETSGCNMMQVYQGIEQVSGGCKDSGKSQSSSLGEASYGMTTSDKSESQFHAAQTYVTPYFLRDISKNSSRVLQGSSASLGYKDALFDDEVGCEMRFLNRRLNKPAILLGYLDDDGKSSSLSGRKRAHLRSMGSMEHVKFKSRSLRHRRPSEPQKHEQQMDKCEGRGTKSKGGSKFNFRTISQSMDKIGRFRHDGVVGNGLGWRSDSRRDHQVKGAETSTNGSMEFGGNEMTTGSLRARQLWKWGIQGRSNVAKKRSNSEVGDCTRSRASSPSINNRTGWFLRRSEPPNHGHTIFGLNEREASLSSCSSTSLTLREILEAKANGNPFIKVGSTTRGFNRLKGRKPLEHFSHVNLLRRGKVARLECLYGPRAEEKVKSGLKRNDGWGSNGLYEERGANGGNRESRSDRSGEERRSREPKCTVVVRGGEGTIGKLTARQYSQIQQRNQQHNLVTGDYEVSNSNSSIGGINCGSTAGMGYDEQSVTRSSSRTSNGPRSRYAASCSPSSRFNYAPSIRQFNESSSLGEGLTSLSGGHAQLAAKSGVYGGASMFFTPDQKCSILSATTINSRSGSGRDETCGIPVARNVGPRGGGSAGYICDECCRFQFDC